MINGLALAGLRNRLRDTDQLQAMAWSFARSLLRSLSVSRRGAKALGLQDYSYFLNLFRLYKRR